MFINKKFERINKNICKAMEYDLDAICYVLTNDKDGSMEIPELYEFCKWWVKNYPDNFIKLKSCLFAFRIERAKLFNSIAAIINLQKDGKKLSPFTIFQLQMLTNNCIDQTNSTCQIIQSLVIMCENALKGK